jgi:hypothetical protein
VSTWQRDCESRSYVELIRHEASLQGVKPRRSTRIRQVKIRERLLANNLALMCLSLIR